MINYISEKYYNLTAFIKGIIFGKCVSKGCNNKATHIFEVETEKSYVKRHMCKIHCNMASKILSKKN